MPRHAHGDPQGRSSHRGNGRDQRGMESPCFRFCPFLACLHGDQRQDNQGATNGLRGCAHHPAKFKEFFRTTDRHRGKGHPSCRRRLVAAARSADKTILSLDERTRVLLRALTDETRALNGLLWAHPANEFDALRGWLAEGHKAAPRWRLNSASARRKG